MRKMFLKMALCALCCLWAACGPQVGDDGIFVSSRAVKGGFPLSEAVVVYDTADGRTLETVAGLFAGDVGRVSGTQAALRTALPDAGNVVLLGTAEGNRWIRRLAESGKLDLSALKGSRERFVLKQVEHPFPGVEQALVIAGSDRRGAAYGAFTLSERMGVSPFYWWTDVSVKRMDRIFVKADSVSEPPSVKFRGIFLNDEDWGLTPWASKTFEPETGNIGPKTYAKVCELVLRLKGNMLAPAMHACSDPFYMHPQNKEVADEYGILVSTSHCEPLLFNNASKKEWDTAMDGAWDYSTNKARILEKLEGRVREAAPYENVYTLAMRGLHDAGMQGNLTESGKVKLLEQAIADQRGLLSKYVEAPLQEIPQIFVPYKEALDLYERGLSVPDDVTLVWPDDNYGYIKRLSNPEEQKRSGGSGVYYHLSYLGAPHDYLWLCTTPPVLMYEELKKAYDTGADRYWLLNVGDIKPMELGVKLFFDMAWKLDAFDYGNVNRYQARFMAEIFGEEYEERFQDVLDDYYRLAWSRKPEFMGWEREWDAPQYTGLKDTEYSFTAYNDARQRLADYQCISDEVARIYAELPEDLRAAFFELLGYPVMGACQMNRKFLLAQLNHELSRVGRAAEANWAAKEARRACDSISALHHRYNSLSDGKWDGMMMLAPGWVAQYQNMPDVDYAAGVGEQAVDLSPQEEQNRLEGCHVVDLRGFTAKDAGKLSIRLVEGIGYDWVAVQMGEATQASVDPERPDGPRVEYALPRMEADSVTVQVYTVPFFPLYVGKGANSFGISVDGQPAVVAQNTPREYSLQWKDQVLRNGALTEARFKIDSSREAHTLTLIVGDPGVMVQRVVVDWGGLEKTYVGPSVALAQGD